jgi:hypothetical protein
MADEEIEYVVPGPKGERINRKATVEHVESGEPKAEPRTVQAKRVKADGPTDVRSLIQRAREEPQRDDK